MITTSQGWKDNQQKQLRSESNVRITFYSINNYKIVSTLGTIDKKNLQNFSFSESGSIICNQRYDVDIRFSLLKFSTNKIDFPNDSLIKIEFGYFINNAWEYISRGYFEIVDVVNKANSFTIDYVAKHINYKLFSQDYKLGMLVVANQTDMSMQNFVNASIKGLLNDYESTKTSFLKGDLTITGNISAWFTDNFWGANDFPTMPYLDVFQVVSQSQGRSYRINGTTNASDEYFTDWKLINLLSVDFTSVDFSFKKYDINFLKHPEIIEQDKIKQINWYYQTKSRFGEGSYGTATATLQNVTKIAYFPTNFRNQTFKYGYKYCFTGGVVGTYSPQTTFNGTNTNFNSEEHYGGVYGGVLDTNATAELKSSNPLTLNDANGWSTFNNYLVKQWANSNLVYDLDLRIDPSVELYDKVAYDRGNEINNGFWVYYGVRDCIVESYTIRFNGAFNGTMRIRDNLSLLPPQVWTNVYNDNNGDEEYETYITNKNNKSITAKIVNEDESVVYGTYTINANSYLDLDNYNFENMPSALVTAFSHYWEKNLSKSIYVYFIDSNGNKTSRMLILQKNTDIQYAYLPANMKDIFNFSADDTWDMEFDGQPNPFACVMWVYVDDYDSEMADGYVQPLGYGYFANGDCSYLDEAVVQYNDKELEDKILAGFTDVDGNVDSDELYCLLKPNMEYKRLEISNYQYTDPTNWSFTITNPYNKNLELFFYCDNEVYEEVLSVNGHSSVTINQSNCSFLTPYIEEWETDHHLDYDIGVYGVNTHGTVYVSSIPSIILSNNERNINDLVPLSSSIYIGSRGIDFFNANPTNKPITIFYSYQGVEYQTTIKIGAFEVMNSKYDRIIYTDSTIAQIYQLYTQHQLANKVLFYGKDADGNKTNTFSTINPNNH